MDKAPSNAWADRRKEGASGRSIFLIKGLVYDSTFRQLEPDSKLLPNSEGRKEGAPGRSSILLKG